MTRLFLFCAAIVICLAATRVGARSADLPYKLIRASTAFSNFPDSIAGSMTQDADFIKSNYVCKSADVVRFKNQSEFAVCGSMRAAPSMPGAFFIEIGSESDFSFVVTRDLAGATQLVSIGGGWGGNPEFVKPVSNGEVLLIEALRDGETYYSIFSTPISCKNTNCVVHGKQCLNKIPRRIHEDIVREVESEKVKTFKAAKPNVDYLKLVVAYSDKLLLRALTGDKKATKMLLTSPFELDAAPAELWAANIDTFKEAEKLGCVPE